ncbi:CoA transferase [Asanoa iriomotensis]|uniref:CoA transferase n=1 Tax=Asanoa iriomotensis TaxID=234613 RepID=A0ABQ4C3X1_9ACTN|nr:CoA transferase [Asanoa iriomotensis]GIF57470.1 CoA transferase [Asanoa iriomotensis]
MSEARPGPLTGHRFDVAGAGPAAVRARDLLSLLGTAPDAGSGLTIDLAGAPSPLTDWAASGAMALTGRADGPALVAPGEPATAVRAALAVFAGLTRARTGRDPDLPGPGLLAERAAIAGFTRKGPISCGGAFRLLSTIDGWLGISLPRAGDLDLVPALTEGRTGTDPWADVAGWARRRGTVAAADRAQLLGIAAAALPRGSPDDEQLRHRRQLAGSDRTAAIFTRGGPRAGRGAPLVVDLTSLWAGPLCAHLLGRAGAKVVKVEGVRRPDGARAGPRAFFDLLHAGHAAVALDLTEPSGLAALKALVGRADIVLEASRPRAMRQLGIDAEQAVANGTSWVSITAYGRTGPWQHRVGFGDDVAAAAGMVVREGGKPLPCGDAIADPLTGVYGAVAAAAALLGENAWLVDIAMRDVTMLAAQGPVHPPGDVEVSAPVARQPTAAAHALGADTEVVLRRLGLA